ncbi:MAG TPA: biotin--[acetyl-CoA-carboxylase] ligase [Stellaceae bacterium]|nr:biotin--[acetyl-CoA-carboxylase] ligase [Stellaceae bacterium]
MTAGAPHLPPGYRLARYGAIDSTNEEAKRLARAGAADRTIVWALQQSAGRGRRGRPWHSPPGNLYASLILRPEAPPERAAQLGFVAALAVGGAFDALLPGLAGLSYKWPNDVLLGGRKLCGILLESEMGEGLAFLVVGIGVNLAAAPPETEFPATSLFAENLPAIAPEVMLTALVGTFEDWMRRWEENGFAPVRAAWRARAAALGQPIRVRLDRITLCGRLVDLDEDGALLLEQAGQCRRIAAGEVFPAGS